MVNTNIVNFNQKQKIETIYNNVKHYNITEFDNDSNIFDEDFKIPLAYTTVGDNEEFEIQVTLDLFNYRVVTEITPFELPEKDFIFRHCEYETFANWNEIIEFTEGLSFEILIDTKVDIDDLIEVYNDL